MASAPATKRMREEATCPICLNLMAEPLSVSCGHSYCKRCIEDFMDSHGHQQQPRGTYPCPQCRAPFHRKSLRPNKQLGSLIEVMKELNLEIMCKKHGEQLHLFCEDEGQLICWRCERSPQHKGHNTVLVEDASPAYKKDLQEAVTNLRELEKECMNRKASNAEQITEWNRKVELQRQKIQADFTDLHSFLQEEEKSYLWKLEQEKEKTLKVLRDNEASLVHTTSELESHIQDLEDRCQGSAQKLLQDVKDALSRSRAMTLEKPEAPSLEIQTVCDVSELYFDVTRMLRDYQVNVTLDPETAHCGLMVSVDQRQVTTGVPQHDVGKSCGRFIAYPCILGCEGFTSGRHYFEVYVGEGTQWEVGVCRENVKRDIRISLNPQSGFWGIRLCRKDGYEALTSPPTILPLRERPLLVGVFLDYEAGAVSFYNMTTASHIFTFPRTSFLGKLRPYFQVYPCSPLFLPPPDK